MLGSEGSVEMLRFAQHDIARNGRTTTSVTLYRNGAQTATIAASPLSCVDP